MSAIVFALIAYVGYAGSDFLSGLASRKIGSYSTAFWLDLLSVVFLTFFIPFFGQHPERITLISVLFIVTIAILATIGLIFFYKGLEKGNASIVGTISGSFAALVVLFSVIFLKQSITTLQIFFIIVIFIGLILTSLDVKVFHKKSLLFDKSVVYAFGAMVLWGIYFTFITVPIKQIGWFWTLYITYYPFLFTFAFMKYKNIPLRFPRFFSKDFYILLVSIVIGVFAVLSYYLAIEAGKTAIVAPIAGSYTTLFVVLSFLFLKEHVTKQQIFGILISLVGIVGLSFLSI